MGVRAQAAERDAVRAELGVGPDDVLVLSIANLRANKRYPEPDGSGADIFSYLLAVEELAWGDLAVAAACTMQSLMGTWFLYRSGA